MLCKFVLENYKNFKDKIMIDFMDSAGYKFSSDCLYNGLISKMLIYGRNATGKTNLGKAIMDIKYTIYDREDKHNEGVFLNADSEKDSAAFSYTFNFDGTELIYKYLRYNERTLKQEEMIIDNTLIYKCDFCNGEYSFDNLDCINAETIVLERYKKSLESSGGISNNKMPFLKWLLNNVALEDNTILIRLDDYIKQMEMTTVGEGIGHQEEIKYKIFKELLKEYNVLKNFEGFLNAMGIECKLTLKELPDGEFELYFKHEKLVPFYTSASSGTLALLKLYWNIMLIFNKESSFIYLDEFDAFYHYEMADDLIKGFKKIYPKTQMIMTTHNTNLMTNRLMRPDCMFILSRQGKLTSLCNATERELREGHNLEKMYISGEFEKYE